MDRATEIELLEELAGLREARSFYLDDAVTAWPVARYTCPDRFAREMQAFGYETAARMDEEWLAELEATAMEINEADPARFEFASEPVYEEFAATVEGGQSLIDRARAAGAPEAGS